MILIKDITNYLESIAPLALQESYDNCGLIVGNKSVEATGALITLDVTEQVVDEAIERKCNLIIAHHPLIFKGIKKLNGNNWTERTIIKAIKNDIAIYAIHTNLDNIMGGVNTMMAEKLHLKECRILKTKDGILKKIVTYCPTNKAEMVKQALFSAGAGKIGNYENCSFTTEGLGTYKANDNAKPYLGEVGKIHTEKEIKIEVIYPAYIEPAILTALMMAHPYEEVAYDIIPLDNYWQAAGSGMIGKLEAALTESDFLQLLKKTFKTGVIKHTKLKGEKIKKVALCGGSGSFLLNDAINAQADIYISADFKYHEYFEADSKIVIADIGHFESEQYTSDLIFNHIQKKFITFATYLSKTKTNPINYF